MPTTPLPRRVLRARTAAVLVTCVLTGLSGCAGAGRPSAGEVIERLNAVGIACQQQQEPLDIRGVQQVNASCLTEAGREIGVLTFDSDDAQEAFLGDAASRLSGSFPVLVYDYGYVLLVPDAELGTRVARRMDARPFRIGA